MTGFGLSKLPSDRGIALSLSRTQYDPATQRHLLRRAARANPFLQLSPIFGI
jgi:hypothetical protein